MYVESFICTDLIACVFPKDVTFNVTGVKEGPSDTFKARANPNGCAFCSLTKDGDVVGSSGPNGDWAVASCTICPNGEINGIGESNTNANTITAYM